MNIHGFFSIISAIFCFVLACFVFFKNYHNTVNRIFSLLCVCFSFWSFCEFQLQQAESSSRASSWITICGLWPFVIPIMMHFILSFTNYIKCFKSMFLLILSYLFATYFTYLNLFSAEYIPMRFAWGWGFELSNSSYFQFSRLWGVIFTILSISFLINYSIRTNALPIRNQTNYIIIGITIVFFFGLISECILPFLSIRIPELTHVSFTLMSAFVGWAIWRHRLFTLDPSTAAETIISTMSDSLAVVNLDNKIEIVNRSLLSVLNYQENELIGKDIYTIIGNFKYQDSTLTTSLRKDFLTDIETTLRKKDGTLIPISLSWSVLKEKNKFLGFVFIARDMSEREKIKDALQKAHDELEIRVEERTAELKKSNEQLLHEITERITAEKKLAEEKERLFVTLKSIGDGVITTDVNGNIIFLNKAAEDIIEFNLEKAVGKNLNEIYQTEKPDGGSPNETTIFEEIINGHNFTLFGRQSVLLSKSGRKYTISETGVPIKDFRDTTIGYVIVFSDITEKYQLEEELFKARKLESISILASGIAHDFNILLTGIITNLFMAKMGVETSTDAYHLITTAEKAAFQASTLLHQLLTFANVGDSSTKEDTSLKELIENSIGFYLKDSKSEYKVNIPDSLYKVTIDRGQIDKTFHNIIQNADQAMPEGGIISVVAQNITIDNRNSAIPLSPGNYAKICISDQGNGITNKNLQKIFDPYFTTKKKGTGLGLSTAYTIIQKHGGHISVCSQLGVGTTFTIFLPASEIISNQTPELNLKIQEIIELESSTA